MNAIFHQLVRTAQKFGCYDYYRCCTIADLVCQHQSDRERTIRLTDFLILLLRQVDENLLCGVVHFKETEYLCAIVGDSNFLSALSIILVGPYVRRRTPISSTIILSNPEGPNELLTVFAIDCVATTNMLISTIPQSCSPMSMYHSDLVYQRR